MIDSIEIDERIAKCERILSSNPQSQIFAALAEAYRKRGDITKAQEICSQGLKLHPDYASARIVMAKLHLVSGNFILAREELNKAIMSVGRTRAIDMLEAEILIAMGGKAEANTILQGLAATDPSDENVQNLLKLIQGAETTIPAPKIDSHKVSENIPIAHAVTPGRKEKRELPLSQALSILKVMPRVLGVLAVGHNGLLLDARFDSAHAKEEFAALSKGIFDSASNGTQKIGIGEAREILLESKSSKLWLFHKGKYILVVFTRDDASMGALKIKIEELFENCEFQGSEALKK